MNIQKQEIVKEGSDFSLRWHLITLVIIAGAIAVLYFLLQPIINAR